MYIKIIESSSICQKIEFHTTTGTALYPFTFSINYEFVDTEVGGDQKVFDESSVEDKKLESEFALCSRTFKNRRGEFRSPRNIFLHGRGNRQLRSFPVNPIFKYLIVQFKGGANSLKCMYRFEADLGEQVMNWNLKFYMLSCLFIDLA